MTNTSKGQHEAQFTATGVPIMTSHLTSLLVKAARANLAARTFAAGERTFGRQVGSAS